MYVKLTSADGYEFILKRKYAEKSETLRRELSKSTPISEDETLHINLHRIQ
jgi:hypothetical protein